jgi:bifunctional aspartokinase / homoserine dehydrogenase 1
MVEALRREFAQDLSHEVVDHITVDPKIAIVAVVGENMRGTPGVAGRTFNALGREGVNIIAIAQGSSEANISFVVEDGAMKQALLATHREFGLGVGSKLGAFGDQMTIPDDFDAPLPHDVLEAFEGKVRREKKT